jgi:hypothetical protein
MHKQVRSREFVPSLSENGGYPEHIITPLPGSTSGQVVEIKLEMFGKLFRMDDQFAI